MSRVRSPWIIAIAAVAVLAPLVAGCGDSATTAEDAASSTAPVKSAAPSGPCPPKCAGKRLDTAFFQSHGYDYSRVDFEGANMNNTILTMRYVFRDARMSGALMEGVIWWDAKLDGADLSGARMRGGDFSRASAVGADLTGADLRSTRWGDGNFTNADLTGADIYGWTIGGTKFSNTTCPDGEVKASC